MEDLTVGSSVSGLVNNESVEIIAVKWYGNSVLNVTFKNSRGQLANQLAYREDEERFDVVFTDPPRAGCSREFLGSLVLLAPKNVVYISCDPQTLARDLLFLTHNGYSVECMQPVDMFPHTRHVETVCLLTKKP